MAITVDALDRINAIEKELVSLKEHISPESAKRVVLRVVERYKDEGRREIDAIELQHETGLSLVVISKALNELEKEGRVRNG